MKKLLKNKKGFTLVELLAVIVVLAIIMVIATQQINRTLKKARTNSLIESAQMAVKSSKILIADNDLTQSNLRGEVEYNSSEYEIYVYNRKLASGNIATELSSGSSEAIIVIETTASGKFSNVDLSLASLPSNYTKFQDNANKKHRICISLNDNGEASGNYTLDTNTSATFNDDVCEEIKTTP